MQISRRTAPLPRQTDLRLFHDREPVLTVSACQCKNTLLLKIPTAIRYGAQRKDLALALTRVNQDTAAKHLHPGLRPATPQGLRGVWQKGAEFQQTFSATLAARRTSVPLVPEQARRLPYDVVGKLRLP